VEVGVEVVSFLLEEEVIIVFLMRIYQIFLVHQIFLVLLVHQVHLFLVHQVLV
jgi:hypothetical protein